MSLVQNNPFYKPNPFKTVNFERFYHPHLSNKSTADYAHLVYHDSYKQSSRVLNNNWTFNDNNLSKRADFSRKYELNNSQITEFQMRMKTSSVYSFPNNQSRVIQHRDGKLQNPFQRKNLIFNKQAVVNQIQVDLSVYRNRGGSNYEQGGATRISQQNAARVSFGTVGSAKIVQSPVLRSKQSNQRTSQVYREVTNVPQVYVESPNPLTYSKTPEMTERESNREKEVLPPKTFQFRRRTFFLNTSNSI